MAGSRVSAVELVWVAMRILPPRLPVCAMTLPLAVNRPVPPTVMRLPASRVRIMSRRVKPPGAWSSESPVMMEPSLG